MNLFRRISTFGAANLLTRISLVNMNLQNLQNLQTTRLKNTVNFSDSENKLEDNPNAQNIPSFLNLSSKHKQEITRYRLARKYSKLKKQQLEKEHQISKRKEIKSPILPSALKKTLERQKKTNENTEISPLI